jgi:uncharacterized membrane protein YgdD (TMEM256/DUF423 family)
VSGLQKRLLLFAIAVMLGSSLFGALYAYRVEHQTLLTMRESYRGAFLAAAKGELRRGQALLGQAEEMNRRRVRHIDAHTHFIKLSTLVLLIALAYPVIGFAQRTRAALATGLLAGAVLFPAGVFLQVYSGSVLFRALAAFGALLAIACFALLAVGLFRGLEDARERA